jgi:hypothetical protein
MSNEATIARTILEQIGRNTIMCLGVPNHSIKVVKETIETDPNGHLGGLEFKFTNCPKVRNGRVVVTLSPLDTYNVQIFNIRGREIYKGVDIYCESLGGPDGVIERVTG